MIVKIPEFDDEFYGGRLDAVLSDLLDDVSRSKISDAIKSKKILVNGLTKKSSYSVCEHDEIYIDDDSFSVDEILPEEMDIPILYEDDDILVVNKPSGLLVHPTYKRRSGTLVNFLISLNIPLSTINSAERMGIVHRLDEDTSGALIVAKNDQSHVKLQNLFKNHLVEKHYRAIVEGRWNEENYTIETGITRDLHNRKKMAVSENGKNAISIFNTLILTENNTYMDVKIETGRTHQIRVHAAYSKHPVVGDKIYGFQKQKIMSEHQMLHAYSLNFKHPISGKDISIVAPFDNEFKRVAKILNIEL